MPNFLKFRDDFCGKYEYPYCTSGYLELAASIHIDDPKAQRRDLTEGHGQEQERASTRAEA